MSKSILVLLLILLIAKCGFSCSCAEVQSIITESIFKDSSNEIFLGEVISKSRIVLKKGSKHKPPVSMYAYRVKVKSNFSLSSSNKEIEIFTSVGNCGVNYEIGKTYLISTSPPKSKKVGRMTSICRRNALEEEAKLEIQMLKSFM